MAAIDFPNSPTVGQVFTSGSRSWVWTGTVWDAKPYGLIAQSDVTNLTSDLAGKASTSHTHTFASITDVNITSPTAGQALVFDSGTSKWINSAPAAAGELLSAFLLMGA